MKVRKKPVIVEAFKWGKEAPQWFIKAYQSGKIYYDKRTSELTIETLEGNMIVRDMDWIIQGVNGEIYPVKDDIFKKTYEILGDDNR